MAEVDKACCSIPAVTTHDYKPKGTYTKLADLDVYTIGPSTSTRALIAVYDIFGFTPQTLQGADLLSHSLDALVLVPDFFKGKPLSLSLYPPDTDEKKKTAGEFMQGTANIDANAKKLGEVAVAAKGEYESVKGWGCYGLCWGGKLAVLHSGAGTVFKAAGTAHPGRLAKDDAEKLTVPFICLFSKEDGTPELMKEYWEALEKNNKENVVEKYGDMHHGWMGARANLEDKENLKEFERGYTQFAKFFDKYL
ncbi:hypothetical protein IMSHALPRED_003378 [Imshaugia aleurites]|uniref:Dienelactone hydrolase domain-containing protein n=1 Tax=Imshaugia aleurites TaxID=172621 RepID=A0A8H3PJ49_9LECA|nr:hypothetical protein IMSHALPRED_003378 [Imshaugia aleurites]